MVKITNDQWYWHHNVSECYYHIQLTLKYRKTLLTNEIEDRIVEIMDGFRERYYIDVHTVGFDKNHIHILCRFLPKYSGGQVIRLIKSITARILFTEFPGLKRELWGGEFWSDGYYISTVSGKGDRKVIEKYIRNQGRGEYVKQLRLFKL